MEPVQVKNKITAIKEFFEKDSGRKVGLEEMKKLTSADREELGKLAMAALGWDKPEENK